MWLHFTAKVVNWKFSSMTTNIDGRGNVLNEANKPSIRCCIASSIFIFTLVTLLSSTSYFLFLIKNNDLGIKLHSLGFIQLPLPEANISEEDVQRYWYYFSNISRTSRNASIECDSILQGKLVEQKIIFDRSMYLRWLN